MRKSRKKVLEKDVDNWKKKLRLILSIFDYNHACGCNGDKLKQENKKLKLKAHIHSNRLFNLGIEPIRNNARP